MGDSDSGYQFGTGIGDDELVRLEAQGAAMAPATRMIFAEAGIRPGMRVLDIGCGAGDVTFVAADLVGLGGSVVGVDHSPDALARARLRAGQRGLTQVQFVEGDIKDRAPGGPYDAIVERLVLWAVPDPAEVLRRQAGEPRYDPGQLLVDRGVRPGRAVHAWPAVVGRCRRGRAAPVGDDRGPAALRTRRRGRDRLLRGVHASGRAADRGHRVATAEEIGMETFEQRVRDEGQRTSVVAASPMLLSAWATTGPE
jgi:SAM-dependent methyltransferase